MKTTATTMTTLASNGVEAEGLGYARSNSHFKHLCVDVPNEGFTITARTPDGHKISFSFIRRSDAEGHECVDIRHHNGREVHNGVTEQHVSVYGVGTTPFNSTQYTNKHEGDPCMLTTVLLRGE